MPLERFKFTTRLSRYATLALLHWPTSSHECLCEWASVRVSQWVCEWGMCICLSLYMGEYVRVIVCVLHILFWDRHDILGFNIQFIQYDIFGFQRRQLKRCDMKQCTYLRQYSHLRPISASRLSNVSRRCLSRTGDRQPMCEILD